MRRLFYTLGLFIGATTSAFAMDPIVMAEGEWVYSDSFLESLQRQDDEFVMAEHVCGGEWSMRVSIDREARRYKAVLGDGIDQADILRIGDRSFTLSYDNEQRRMDNGELHVWHWFFEDSDTFVWVRDDWVGTGGKTARLHRCKSAVS